MSQRQLFETQSATSQYGEPIDPVAAFQRHSPTSKEAAEAIEPKAGTLRAKVLAFIRRQSRHGATDEEIQDALRMNPSTQRPRRVELVEQKLRAGSGTRPTRSGRAAVVWVAK